MPWPAVFLTGKTGLLVAGLVALLFSRLNSLRLSPYFCFASRRAVPPKARGWVPPSNRSSFQ